MAARVDSLEPLPAPERPPERRLSPKEWARENLVATWFDAILTILFGLIIAWLVYRVGKFVFFDARWEIIERNITNLMVSRFPRDELWRVGCRHGPSGPPRFVAPARCSSSSPSSSGSRNRSRRRS